ncbi:ATP-binding protein [Pirellulaceae bacterium SH449]
MAKDEIPAPDTKGRFTPSPKLKCLLVFVAAYIALSVVGDYLLVDGSTAGPIWPAAGFGLVAVVLCGRIALLAIFIGSLISTNYGGIEWTASFEQHLARFLGLPLANTMESWIAVSLARILYLRRRPNVVDSWHSNSIDLEDRLQGPWRMDSLRAVTILMIAIFVGSCIGAAIGGGIYTRIDPTSNYLAATLSWWGADATAMIVVLPVLAVIKNCNSSDWIAAASSRFLFGYVIVLIMLFMCFAGFIKSSLAKEFLLCLIAGSWILICAQGNLAVVVVGLSLIVSFCIPATTLGLGPFVGRAKPDEYLIMQAYLIVITFCGLCLHGLIRETNRANQLLMAIKERETIQRYETKLEESSRLLQEKKVDLDGVLGTFPDLYFWLSQEGKYLRYYANQELFVPPEVFIGKHISEVIPSDICENLLAAFQRCCHSGQTEEVEYSLEMNGAEYWFEGRFKLLENDQVLVVIRNITRRKESEQQIQALLAQREIDSELLSLRAKELTRSNAELEQFAYVASHDLREPLRMVRSFCSILFDKYSDSLPSEAKEYLNFAMDGSQRMQQMIDDLLTLSRVGAGRYLLRTCSLEQACDEAISTLKHSIQEKKIRIVKGNLPQVVADKERLEQVLLNLIGNAVKFSRTEDPEIFLDCEEDLHQWKIKVVDNGIGIEEQYFDRIFLLFERLNPSSNYAGSGLGLALCKKIVEQHGGAIGVTSAVSSGSQFWFTLPK